jgi:cytochrome oxidase Cu insertion factor (SCO1/SenC/PrrC family)
MPGMNSGPSPASPVLVSAFRSALLHQALIIALIFALLFIAWGATRTAVYGKLTGPARAWPEPAARRVLRVSFGILWLFDGILQAQPQMAGGLTSQVIRPATNGSPAWVGDVVNWGANIWEYHPIAAAASSVWIQVGLGLWLILVPRGIAARLAALSSMAWGLIVWAFGESFGGIFAPGLTVLFGAPGAVLLYVVAGALLLLPVRTWEGPRAGRLILAGGGLFFLGMALLQAWPGRGFWQGSVGGRPGSLARMVQSMAGISQPHALEAIVSGFANVTVAHGFAVNLVAVLVLGLTGAAMTVSALRREPRLALIAVTVATVFCLADWLLVEDLGFLGGLGTDPNNMIPIALLLVTGYLGLAAHPGPAAAAAATPAVATAGNAETAQPAQPEPAGRGRGGLGGLLRGLASVPAGVIAGAGAFAIVLVGAAPMALASVNRTADPIVAEAIAGTSGTLDTPAPNFTLTSQAGRPVTLSSLRGKVVLLTFLDPVCTTDCPLIAQEMRLADTLLGSKAKSTELVAVVANPTYHTVAYTQAFDRQEGLGQLSNWLYLTGSLSQLDAVWHHYGIEVENLPAGAMSAHNDLAFVIDSGGVVRQEISDDPGPGTAASKSSFASLMAGAVTQSLGQGQ